ncbi:phosphodiester glycosidase family protein [Desertivirga xinjiangensis]|uniref:phosphodiester glycosidase family protein n=1 Tax=Desertivirga xinjiangensis TaxID=539206 RepID=UPI00210A46A9|nr:phosphodiester glycosidase family protein [Pedobacter xinjiangensis]
MKTKAQLLKVLYIFIFSVLLSSCEKDNKFVFSETLISREESKIEYADEILAFTDLFQSKLEDTTYTLYEGVNMTKVKLLNKDDEPLQLYFLTVNLAYPGITMEAAMPNNQHVFGRQKVRDMITHKNAALSDQEVVAALNGDYWDTSTNGEPLGPVIMNTEVVKPFPSGTYYFLSVLKNNTAEIGNSTLFGSLTYQMKETLGGRYLLVNEGLDRSASLNKNVEPRTSVGLLSKSKVVFMVVDGRKVDHSVGISMQDMAKIFMAIGAKTAINLDGGGSSTLIERQISGDYSTVNQPTDNPERSVANAWTIIRDKD